MILKNEGGTIFRALSSLNVDEYVIGIDDSTTDNTLGEVGKFAKDHNVNAYMFRWEDDFSKARNEGIAKATSEYVFILDGHETVENYIPPTGHDVYMVNVRMNQGGYKTLVEQPRLFKKRNYFNKSHNQIHVDEAYKIQTTINHKRSEKLSDERMKQRENMNFKDLSERIQLGDDRAKLQLAHEYMAFKMWDEAILWFKEYKGRSEQEKYQVLINLGLCYYHSGDKESAEKYFKMCDKDVSRNAHLVFLASMKNDIGLAKQALNVPKPKQFSFLYEDFYYDVPLKIIERLK